MIICNYLLNHHHQHHDLTFHVHYFEINSVKIVLVIVIL